MNYCTLEGNFQVLRKQRKTFRIEFITSARLEFQLVFSKNAKLCLMPQCLRASRHSFGIQSSLDLQGETSGSSSRCCTGRIRKPHGWRPGTGLRLRLVSASPHVGSRTLFPSQKWVLVLGILGSQVTTKVFLASTEVSPSPRVVQMPLPETSRALSA